MQSERPHLHLKGFEKFTLKKVEKLIFMNYGK